jgi:hypothetical protein
VQLGAITRRRPRQIVMDEDEVRRRCVCACSSANAAVSGRFLTSEQTLWAIRTSLSANSGLEPGGDSIAQGGETGSHVAAIQFRL